MDPELKAQLLAHIATQTAEMEARKVSENAINAAVAKLRSEYDALDARIRQGSVHLPGSELPDNGKKFSWLRAINAIVSRDWTNAGLEKEHFQETAKRTTMSTLNGQNMGFLVSIEQAREILKPAVAEMVMTKLGATVYSDLVGDLPFPDVTSRPSLAFGVENVAASASSVNTGKQMMRPKTGKMLVKISNKLNMQSMGTAEQIIREQLELGIQLGIDNAAINGSGANSEPLGIFNVSGIVSNIVTTGTPKRFTVDKAAQLLAEVEDRNFMPTGILSKPRVFSGMKRERVQQYSGDEGGAPVMGISPIMTDVQLSGLLGITIAKSTQCPYASATLAKVIAGAWKEFKIGYWGGIRLAASDTAGTSFENDELWIRAFIDMDTLCAKTTAFEMCVDAECTEANWVSGS